jgi:hypothetical protein
MIQAGYPGSLGYLNELTWGLNPGHLEPHREQLAEVTQAAQAGNAPQLLTIGTELLTLAIN